MRQLLGSLLVIAIGGAVLASCVGFDYVHYDDYEILTRLNAYLSDPRNLIATFSHDAFAYMGPETAGLFYRPVLVISFGLDTLIGGARPVAYHTTSLALHLLLAGLVFALLVRVSGAFKLSFFLALVFCLHPALVAVPAWIPARNDSLLAIFAILHAVFLVGFLKRGGGVLLFATLAALALALFNKESAVALA